MKTITNETYEVENTLINHMPSDVNAHQIYLTDDKDFIRGRAHEMFTMLQKGYADKGVD